MFLSTFREHRTRRRKKLLFPTEHHRGQRSIDKIPESPSRPLDHNHAPSISEKSPTLEKVVSSETTRREDNRDNYRQDSRRSYRPRRTRSDDRGESTSRRRSASFPVYEGKERPRCFSTPFMVDGMRAVASRYSGLGPRNFDLSTATLLQRSKRGLKSFSASDLQATCRNSPLGHLNADNAVSKADVPQPAHLEAAHIQRQSFVDIEHEHIDGNSSLHASRTFAIDVSPIIPPITQLEENVLGQPTDLTLSARSGSTVTAEQTEIRALRAQYEAEKAVLLRRIEAAAEEIVTRKEALKSLTYENHQLRAEVQSTTDELKAVRSHLVDSKAELKDTHAKVVLSDDKIVMLETDLQTAKDEAWSSQRAQVEQMDKIRICTEKLEEAKTHQLRQQGSIALLENSLQDTMEKSHHEIDNLENSRLQDMRRLDHEHKARFAHFRHNSTMEIDQLRQIADATQKKHVEQMNKLRENMKAETQNIVQAHKEEAENWKVQRSQLTQAHKEEIRTLGEHLTASYEGRLKEEVSRRNEIMKRLSALEQYHKQERAEVEMRLRSDLDRIRQESDMMMARSSQKHEVQMRETHKEYEAEIECIHAKLKYETDRFKCNMDEVQCDFQMRTSALKQKHLLEIDELQRKIAATIKMVYTHEETIAQLTKENAMFFEEADKLKKVVTDAKTQSATQSAVYKDQLEKIGGLLASQVKAYETELDRVISEAKMKLGP